jgi:5-methylcytosine-specific restriction endonuclease McrA
MPRAPKACGIHGCRTIVPNGRRCPDHADGWRDTPRTASSAATSGTNTSGWRKLRAEILDRDGHQCQIRYPGVCTGRATVVDKITPAATRPDLAHNRANLRAACKPCNATKANTTDRR